MNRPAKLPPDACEQSRRYLVEQLRGKIRRVETTHRNDDGTIVSSGSAAIDDMLPAGGYHRGTIVEWLADTGSSAGFLSLLAARNAAKEGGALVIVDQHNLFYPPAARSLGINLGNLILLRSNTDSRYRFHNQIAEDSSLDREDFYWAIDQSLRCNAVAAVWGTLPDFETPQIATRWLRRFQLSAETSGCLGLFMRQFQGDRHRLRTAPFEPSRQSVPVPLKLPSWSDIQWQIVPQHSHGDNRRLRAVLVRCRGGTAGRHIDLEINTVTGNVHKARREHAQQIRSQTHSLPLAAQLAHPAAGRRTTRA